ncbi:MAG TPA: hypothetical protein VKI64_05970, partial [Acidimicrobiales bacterium]|nr:hypothetical protein [Acidimicrobiales bacterium]
AHLVLALALRDAGRTLDDQDNQATWNQIVRRLHQSAPATVARLSARPRPARHWPVRALAAAAALIALVVASLRSEPGSLLYPVRTSLERTAVVLLPNDASIRLRIADARLDDLVHTLSQGPVAAAPGVARALVAGRAAAIRDGANVRVLDAAIRSEVPPVLITVPAGVVNEVRGILGRLLPPFMGKSNGTGNGSRHQEPSNALAEPGDSQSAPPAGPVTEGTDRGSAGSDEGTSSVGGSKGSEGSGSSGSERSGGSDQGSGGSETDPGKRDGGSSDGTGSGGSEASGQGSDGSDQGSGGTDQSSGGTDTSSAGTGSSDSSGSGSGSSTDSTDGSSQDGSPQATDAPSPGTDASTQSPDGGQSADTSD